MLHPQRHQVLRTGSTLALRVLSDDKGIDSGFGAETHQFHGGRHSTNRGSDFDRGDSCCPQEALSLMGEKNSCLRESLV